MQYRFDQSKCQAIRISSYRGITMGEDDNEDAMTTETPSHALSNPTSPDVLLPAETVPSFVLDDQSAELRPPKMST
jgi:hypothetical protein